MLRCLRQDRGSEPFLESEIGGGSSQGHRVVRGSVMVGVTVVVPC